MDKRGHYKDLTNRNIGLFTPDEQNKLKNSCVAVFGLGGLGGVVAEVLCRTGIGHLKIIEHGEFEPTNLNRQIFCFCSTLDKKKREVAGSFMKDINPEARVELYEKEDENNISDILKGAAAAVLAVDKVRACIVISREARRQGIPLIESWAMPYGNVRVFTKDTLSLEEAYKLPSIGKNAKDISEEEFKKIDAQMLNGFIQDIEGLPSFVTELVKNRMAAGENSTLAPFVWMNSIFMSIETIKVLLHWGDIALAPKFALYDPLLFRIPKQNPDR